MPDGFERSRVANVEERDGNILLLGPFKAIREAACNAIVNVRLVVGQYHNIVVLSGVSLSALSADVLRS